MFPVMWFEIRHCQISPCHATGAAEATSIKTIHDMDPARSSKHFQAGRDANQDALVSAIKSDIATDQQACSQPHLSHTAAAATHGGGSGGQPHERWHQDPTTASRTALGKDLSGDQSTVAAESISPRYSSQQSQGTNVDWEEATVHREVTSKQAQPQPHTSPSQGASIQQHGIAAAPPGTIEHHVANQNMEEYGQYLGQVYQGHFHDDPAKDPKPEPPSSPQKLASRSSLRARAMADDVKGMAPIPGCSMVGEEGGGRRWLKRAFSMVDQENMGIDMDSQMDSLDKVLALLHAVSLVLYQSWMCNGSLLFGSFLNQRYHLMITQMNSVAQASKLASGTFKCRKVACIMPVQLICRKQTTASMYAVLIGTMPRLSGRCQ